MMREVERFWKNEGSNFSSHGHMPRYCSFALSTIAWYPEGGLL